MGEHYWEWRHHIREDDCAGLQRGKTGNPDSQHELDLGKFRQNTGRVIALLNDKWISLMFKLSGRLRQQD